MPLPGLNELLAWAKSRRGAWSRYATQKRRWERQLVQLIKNQRLKPVACAWLWLLWVEPTRRRDPDNVAAGGRKLLLDALVASGVLPADNWRAIRGWTDQFLVDPDQAGVYVTIEARDGATGGNDVDARNQSADRMGAAECAGRRMRQLACQAGVRGAVGTDAGAERDD
jgi:hypothetical protein